MKGKAPWVVRSLLAVAMLLPAGAGAVEASDDLEKEIRDLRSQVEKLGRRLQQLERRQQPPRPSPPAPKVTVDDRGFALASADNASALRLGGLVQLDSRTYFGAGEGTINDTFVLRRARILATGRLSGIYSFQIVPEFGGSSVSLLDANLTVAPTGRFKLKVGRFKAPVGLEQLQSDSVTFFVERSAASSLVPNRDLGVQLEGGSTAGTLTWVVGIFNGVADAASSTNTDIDNSREVMGRLFLWPFAGDRQSAFRGSGLGVAGSYGRRKGTAGVASGHKTEGQQTFFKYTSGVMADGTAWRLSPQAYVAAGPFSALGEYVVSAVTARPAAAGGKTELQNRAWQLAAGWVVTGEDATYAGVMPRRPFSWTEGYWGAWQVAVRHARLRLDDQTFPTFAAPATWARGTDTTAVGVNWYLSRAVRASLDYFQTHFDVPEPLSSNQILRQDEKVVISRFQLSF